MIHWVCCSSKRSEMFLKKTWKTLQRGKLSKLLYLCVPELEVLAYKTVIPPEANVRIVPAPVRGLVQQRLHMRSLLPPYSDIVFIDDDVEAIRILNHNGQHLSGCEDLEALTADLFTKMGPNSRLWGVYPVANRMWMSPTAYSNNAYIVGAFYGIINHPQLWEPARDECEDYGRQLSEQAEGRDTVRFNWVGIQTNYFRNTGGMQQDRNTKKREEAINLLVKTYPDLVKPHQKKDGTLDLRFLGKPATFVPEMSADQSIHEEALHATLSPRGPYDQELLSPDHTHQKPPSPQGCRLR